MIGEGSHYYLVLCKCMRVDIIEHRMNDNRRESKVLAMILTLYLID